MADELTKSALDSPEKDVILDIKEAPPSKDATRKLSLPAEKMLKRFAQIGEGLFYVIVMDGEPIMVVAGGKIEILQKLTTR